MNEIGGPPVDTYKHKSGKRGDFKCPSKAFKGDDPRDDRMSAT